MSTEIPMFSLGDRVRVMQTTEMERRGIANQHGCYTRNGFVRLGSGGIVHVGDDSLLVEICRGVEGTGL